MTPRERVERLWLTVDDVFDPERGLAEHVEREIAEAIVEALEAAARRVEALQYPRGPLSSPAVFAAVRAVREGQP